MDGEISKSDGKQRSYDAYATSMGNSVIRIACCPKTATGSICFGLTPEAADEAWLVLNFLRWFVVFCFFFFGGGAGVLKKGDVETTMGRERRMKFVSGWLMGGF